MNTELVRQGLDHLTYGPAPESDAAARAWLKSRNSRFGHFIDGDFRPPHGGAYFQTVDPATGKELARVAQGDSEDVNVAVEAARRAFPSWSGLSGHRRALFLYAIARAIAKHARLFAVLESLDNGKTIRETRDVDIPLVVRHFTYFAGIAQTFDELYPDREPGGVVAQIIPWNFPLLMLAWKIAPAIAAGNTVVLKPAEFTPLTALLFAQILGEVKLPSGVVNIVTGDGKTGAALVAHPTPWKIAFTGSTEVGRIIRKQTAGSGKHLTLELGGKSPFIVFEDADLDAVVEGVVQAIWFNQGQVCCAGSRLLVQESVYDLVIDKIKRRMENLRGGSPLDKAMDIGAINSREQFEKINGLVEQGRTEGAEIFQPASWSCPTEGWFFPPTLCTLIDPADTLAQVEIFGPVLVAMSFRTPSEAIEMGNNTRYGLAVSIWTQDAGKALDIAASIKAGTVWVNCTNRFDAASGFGGYRESGYGREGGLENMYDVTVERGAHDPRAFFGAALPDSSIPGEESVPLLEPSLIKIDRTHRFLIGGKLVRPDGAACYSIVDPTGVSLATVGDANRKDVRNAVEAARGATNSWAAQTAHLRGQILYFFAENLAIHSDRFATDIATQTGRSIESGNEEVALAIERLFRCAALADKFVGTVQPVASARTLVTAIKESIGVIGIRAPDAYPLLGLICTIGPALAMGNTVVLIAGRHALTACELIRVIQNSDVPAGVLNVLTASNPDAMGNVLASHEDVDAIWSFGDGKAVSEVEARSISNMKRTFSVSNLDWTGPRGASLDFFRAATQIKNIWVPYGA